MKTRTALVFFDPTIGQNETAMRGSRKAKQGGRQKAVAGIKGELMPESNAVHEFENIDQKMRSIELDELLIGVIDDPETWLRTPSTQFGGRRPGDLIGTEEETKLFDLLHAVDQGLF